jgi:cob(I)alamin adenosyltransferase
MKIYTKTGDDGTTALFDGTRVTKDHERVDLYGDVDELNASLGLAASFVSDEKLKADLLDVQKDLFALGAHLANPAHKKQKAKSDFDSDKVIKLENHIDAMVEKLSPMTGFILPGGHSAAAALHMARTICRRVERKLVKLGRDEKWNVLFLPFINRLSDYLFVAARFANHLSHVDDVPW